VDGGAIPLALDLDEALGGDLDPQLVILVVKDQSVAERPGSVAPDTVAGLVQYRHTEGQGKPLHDHPGLSSPQRALIKTFHTKSAQQADAQALHAHLEVSVRGH
jgi:hypothetical protein